MATMEVTKAKDTFGDTINRVAYAKERITLTRRGKAVAVIVPVEDAQLLNGMRETDREDAPTARKRVAPEEVADVDPQAARREAMRRIVEEADREAGVMDDPTVTREKLFEMMRANGVRAEDNTFSRDIVEHRYPDETPE